MALGEATAKRRKTSRSGDSLAGGLGSGSGTVEGVHTLTTLVAPRATVAPRVCKDIKCGLCGSKDSDPDPCFPEMYLIWAYPQKADGTVSGDTCVYCGKTFNGFFKAKHGAITKFKEDVKQPEVRNEFDIGRGICDKRVKETRSIGTRLNGTAATAELMKAKEQVTHKRKRESMILCPEDEVWDEKTYCREHGDWRANGLGHVKGVFEGVQGILVPAKKIWKLQHRHGSEASHTRIVDDGQDQMLDGAGRPQLRRTHCSA